MRYFVIAFDGKKYGPADIPTLNQWIAEGRITPSQLLEEEGTGVRVVASSVAGLVFGPTMAHPGPESFGAGMPYQGYYNRQYVAGDNGKREVNYAWGFGIAGLLCCGLLGIPGLIFANQAIQKGNPGGSVARILNIVVLVFMALGTCLYVAGGLFGGFDSSLRGG